MNGGIKDKSQDKLVLWSTAILFAFLIICPVAAILITCTAHYDKVPNESISPDIYLKNEIQPPFWPLENNIYGGLSEDEIDNITGYIDENRRESRTAARINFGACRAVFIDRGDFVHEIVFYNENKTEYDLIPELVAEDVKRHPGKVNLTAGYRIYRIYPEFPAYYNADIPYIDFTEIWEDGSVSCIAGEIVRVRTEGRFYRNTDGTIANVLDMTEATKISPLVFSNEKMASSGVRNSMGTVSFDGEYAIASIPFMPKIYIDSEVTSGPFNDVGRFSFANITLSSSVGAIGLIIYLFLLVMLGREIFGCLSGRTKNGEKEKKEK